MSTAPEEPIVQGPIARRTGWLRRLYAWVMHWAETPYALPALVILSFCESSFFPVPPDVLLMALCLGRPKRALVFALWCGIASVAGGVLGYYIGYAFYEQLGAKIIQALGYEHHFETVGRLYGENGFFAIVTAAFTPIPYKVFTIAAGVFHDRVSLGTLVLASIAGRFARFFLVAGAIYVFGPTVKRTLDKYLELATILLTILAVGGFVAVKFLSDH